jgi:dipeptidyl aminopeptidase/acylaminoacyl peptidase
MGSHVIERRTVLLLVLVVAVLGGLTGCAGPRLRDRSPEPTITAILLPTRTPTRVAQLARPTATATPTDTPRPEPTATVVAQPTPAPTMTATALPPTATQEPAPTATETATATAAPAARQPTATPPDSAAEFSGRLVFQVSIGGMFYTINADGTGLRRITDGVDPIWSPDGTRIAFTRWRNPRGVWVINADGSGERRVFDWNSARWPSWSPDGTQILFSRQHGGRTEEAERCFFGFCFDLPAKPHWRLGRVQIADGSFSEPPSPLYSLAPAWSPDGRQIVYAGEHGLVIQTLDGEVSYQITADGRDTGPVWSPDGSRVAFTRRQHDHWEVYVVDAGGGNLARLTETPERLDGQPGSSAAPAWSPDGRSIAFFTDRAGRRAGDGSQKWEIWVMRAGGSRQKPMFASALDGLDLAYSAVGDRGISWTR